MCVILIKLLRRDCSLTPKYKERSPNSIKYFMAVVR